MLSLVLLGAVLVGYAGDEPVFPARTPDEFGTLIQWISHADPAPEHSPEQ